MTTTTDTLAAECALFEAWVRSIWDLGATDDPLELQGRLLDAWKSRAALEAQAEAKPTNPVTVYTNRGAAPAAPADLYERLAAAHDASLDGDHRACRVILTGCMSRLAAPAAPAPANIRERWNIERDGDDLLVCFNNHDKGEKCEYERFVRAPAAPALEPSPYCLWPSRGSCRAWQDKQAEAKPLTPEQVRRGWATVSLHPHVDDRFTAGVRFAEQAHRIGAASKGGGKP